MTGNNNKILIIEDDQTIANMYKASLKQVDYEVAVAADGEEGLTSAVSGRPNLILLDIMLPRMDGFAVLEKIKSDDKIKDIPVIMLTNLGQDEDKERGKRLGAADYWVKADLTPAQINDKIKKYLS